MYVYIATQFYRNSRPTVHAALYIVPGRSENLLLIFLLPCLCIHVERRQNWTPFKASQVGLFIADKQLLTPQGEYTQGNAGPVVEEAL